MGYPDTNVVLTLSDFYNDDDDDDDIANHGNSNCSVGNNNNAYRSFSLSRNKK